MLPAAISNIVGPVRIADQPTITQKICQITLLWEPFNKPLDLRIPSDNDQAGSTIGGTALLEYGSAVWDPYLQKDIAIQY